MSDPARPPMGELSSAQKALAVAPDAYFEPSEAYIKSWEKKNRTLEKLQEKCVAAGLQLANSVMRTPKYGGPTAQKTGSTPKYALADSGPGVLRVRSAAAKALTNVGFDALPERWEFGDKEGVAEKIATTVRVDTPGTETCLGRLLHYMPKPGQKTLPESNVEVRPPGRRELAHALHNCGLALTSRAEVFDNVPNNEGCQKYSLVPVAEEARIAVTAHSSNGLPTLGSSSDPVDMQRCVELAVAVRAKLEAERASGGVGAVERWVRRAEKSKDRAQLVTLILRAKPDCYSTAKMDKNMLRAYTVWPRWMQLIIQQGYQPMKKAKRHMLSPQSINDAVDSEREGRHTFSGASLVHGGSDRIVLELDKQLEETDVAYMHHGDDTLFAVRIGPYIVVFDCDFTAFDLTMMASVTAPVKAALAEQHAMFDPVGSELWHAIMKERNIVVHHRATYRTAECGLSGAVGQSDVNDLSCDVYCQRVENDIQRLRAHYEGLLENGAYNGGEVKLREDLRADIAAILLHNASTLGFRCTMGECAVTKTDTLREHLIYAPALFVGYRFINVDGTVRPFCDIGRTLAQIPYPALGRVGEKDKFNALDALRLGGIVLSMGVPPPYFQTTFTAMKWYALSQVHAAVEYLEAKGVGKEAYRHVYSLSEWGPDLTELDAAGIYRALLKEPHHLWLFPIPPPGKPENLDSRFYVDEGVSMSQLTWGEEVNDYEEKVRKIIGAPEPRPDPPGNPHVSRDPEGLPLPEATRKNHGRQPRLKERQPPRAAPPRVSAGVARAEHREAAAQALAADDGDQYENPFEDPKLVAAYEAQAQMEANLAESDDDVRSRRSDSVHSSDRETDDEGIDVDLQYAEDARAAGVTFSAAGRR